MIWEFLISIGWDNSLEKTSWILRWVWRLISLASLSGVRDTRAGSIIYLERFLLSPVSSGTPTRDVWPYTCRRPSDSAPLPSGHTRDQLPLIGSLPFLRCSHLLGAPIDRLIAALPPTPDKCGPGGPSLFQWYPSGITSLDPIPAVRTISSRPQRRATSSRQQHSTQSSSSSSSSFRQPSLFFPLAFDFVH